MHRMNRSEMLECVSGYLFFLDNTICSQEKENNIAIKKGKEAVSLFLRRLDQVAKNTSRLKFQIRWPSSIDLTKKTMRITTRKPSMLGREC